MNLDYRNVLVALDGSQWSKWAEEWAVHVATCCRAVLHGLHVYAARMHRTRFEQMEPGLPEAYQQETELRKLRGTHDQLIGDGLKLISDSYLRDLHRKAQLGGINFRTALPEGKHYVEILRHARKAKADLLILGAKGLGASEMTQLGSVAERVLMGAPCDILIVRSVPPERLGAVMVGVDGSEFALRAVLRGAAWAQSLGAGLRLVSVYDPEFHTGVFRTIAQVLPEDTAARFDFRSQERLHDEIIDHGLAQLYRSYLEQAAVELNEGPALETELLRGKPFQALVEEALPGRASLIVVGRHGAHHERASLIGSNALAVARYAPISVLVTAGRHRARRSGPKALASDQGLLWEPEAEERLQRVPAFARRMAKRAIERYVRERGLDRVTLEVYLEAKERFGM